MVLKASPSLSSSDPRKDYLNKLWSLVSGIVSNPNMPPITTTRDDDDSFQSPSLLPKSIILPCIGETPIEIVLFVGTSALFRCYMWWSWRRCGQKAQSTKWNTQRTRSWSQSNHPVPTSCKPLQDPGLYAFVALVSAMTANSRRNDNKQPILPESVRLPYLGDISMEVLLFVGTTVCFRIHMFWRGWWRAATDSTLEQNHDDSRHRNNHSSNNNNNSSRPPPDGQGTQYKRHKDPHLYAFIDLTQQQRSQLRKVPDPEESRRERLLQLKEQQKGKPSGPLGLCDSLLQSKRTSLKATTSEEPKQ